MSSVDRSLAEWCVRAAVLTACFIFTRASESAEEPKPEPPAVATKSPTPQKVNRFDFNGDTPGAMTLAEFRTKYADAKKSKPSTTPDIFDKVQGCERFEVRGEPYGMKLAAFPIYSAHYQFLDGVLHSIRISVHEKDPKGLIVGELEKRYGKPKVEDMDYIGRVMTWDNGTSQIQFIEKVRNATFSDSGLEKIHDERLKAVVKAEIEAEKKAASEKSKNVRQTP